MTAPLAPPPVSDMAVAPSLPPASPFDQVVTAVGNLARPFTIYAVGYASAAAIHEVGKKVSDGNDGAIYLGAVGLILGLVIGARAVENINAVRQAAKVDAAKARAGAGD